MSPYSGLHTDLYQLTMAQGYWKLGMAERRAAFELFFREAPFGGSYAVACGLAQIIDWIEHYHFSASEIDYLKTMKGNADIPLFEMDFLNALKHIQLTVDIDAMPEGTVVFPKEPLLRVTGPLWQCQLLETLLLNLINFPTLIATKSARICSVANPDEVVEFGLRRAQGPDGGLTASRAAYVGGVSATSNVLAGKQFGIPVVGTHAHSWVMAFNTEKEAFESYAKVMPQNCILLVDTYHTLDGVKEAIELGLQLQKEGFSLTGIRLDSGDLLKLSQETRVLLDQAGLTHTKIVASSDLDEYKIQSYKENGSKIAIWGVGTRLVTGFDQPALGGVYKLVAIQSEAKDWIYKYKQSDDLKKQSLPGIHNVLRVQEKGIYRKDIIVDVLKNKDIREYESQDEHPSQEWLLKPIFRQGKLIYTPTALNEVREQVKRAFTKFPKNILRLSPTTPYPVELAQ